MYSVVFFFFFFQAEDGIRDLTVTGVQTCALPILAVPAEVSLASIPSRVMLKARSREPKTCVFAVELEPEYTPGWLAMSASGFRPAIGKSASVRSLIIVPMLPDWLVCTRS